MSGFVLHPEANTDLDEIWEYIAADNLDAADRVLEEIYEAILSLVPFPGQGHNRPDFTSRPLRFHPVRDFLIAYAPEETLSWWLRYSTDAAVRASLRPCCAEESESRAGFFH